MDFIERLANIAEESIKAVDSSATVQHIEGLIPETVIEKYMIRTLAIGTEIEQKTPIDAVIQNNVGIAVLMQKEDVEEQFPYSFTKELVSRLSKNHRLDGTVLAVRWQNMAPTQLSDLDENIRYFSIIIPVSINT